MPLDYFTLRDRLSDRQRTTLKALAGIIVDVVPYPWSLDLLALRYGTDKVYHGYMTHYARYFSPLRHKRLNLLEIGVGTYGPRGGGASLRMWKRYFWRGQIYGLDILDKREHEEPRIKIFQGSQTDRAFLTDVVRQIGPVHIIIDDGSHVNEHVHISFHTLFPLLADGGIYVIEDMQTSYLQNMGGSATNLNTGQTSMNLVKGFSDNINSMFIPGRKTNYFDDHIQALHVHQNIAFIFKGNNRTYRLQDYAKKLIEKEEEAMKKTSPVSRLVLSSFAGVESCITNSG